MFRAQRTQPTMKSGNAKVHSKYEEERKEDPLVDSDCDSPRDGATLKKKKTMANADPDRASLPEDRPFYIINPKHWYMSRWDVVMILALVFTALVTPFEVAFIKSKE